VAHGVHAGDGFAFGGAGTGGFCHNQHTPSRPTPCKALSIGLGALR
jgi:hypothetical protein